VSDIAHAEKANPGVMDQIGSFYAKNPEIVKMLGGAALAIALGRIAIALGDREVSARFGAGSVGARGAHGV